jgi:hypothetical protein
VLVAPDDVGRGETVGDHPGAVPTTL